MSLGVVAGAGASADFQNQFFPGFQGGPGFTNYSTPKRYMAGAMVDIGFGAHFSVEVDGLYRPLGYTFAGVEPGGALNSISPATVVTWEFPVLAKYRFSFAGVKPFVEAGPAFRTAGNLNSANPSHAGVTAGLGVETRLRGLRIAPAVRYTRWAADPEGFVRTVPNQVEFLVGFSASGASDWHPFGRRVSFGVAAGTGLTDDFPLTRNTYINPLNGMPVTNLDISGPRSLIAGPVVELALLEGFTVEAEALRRPMHMTIEAVINGVKHTGAEETIAEWDFPVLAKYRFHAGSLRPFLEGGPSFRLTGGQSGASHYGITAGAGVEEQMHRLKIAPAIRYTRWVSNATYVTGGQLPNQVELVVGFSF